LDGQIFKFSATGSNSSEQSPMIFSCNSIAIHLTVVALPEITKAFTGHTGILFFQKIMNDQ
jgi:hypothetical protein